MVVTAQKVIYNFERLSTEDGLPSNTIYDIIQDHQGFLWYGTDKGLCRYDGYRMKVFVHDSDNPKSISSNMVKRIFEGKNGKIWIASLQAGLSCYDPLLPEQDAFTNYPSNLKDSSSLLNNEIYDVYEDSEGYIWVAGLDTDLQRLDPTTGKFETISLGEVRSSHKSFFRFLPDKEKKYLWLGSRHDGFFKFNPSTRKTLQFNYQHLSKATENSIGAFAIEEDKLWVSYYNLGLSVLDTKTNTFTPDVFKLGRNVNFYDNVLLTLSFGQDQVLWGGHVNKGIYLFNTETNQSQRITWSELTPGDTLASRVEVIFFDKSNIGWIGTSGKGLLKYDPYHNQFNQFNTFSNDHSYGNVLQLIQKGDDIWFRTEKGIGKYNTVLKRTEFFISSKEEGLDIGQINFINGQLYVSSTNKGLWYVDQKAKKMKAISLQGDTKGLEVADINTVVGDYRDGDSILWIGSWSGGLYQYDQKKQTVKLFTTKDGLPDNKVIEIAQDHRGYLWVATQGHGLACLRDKRKIEFEVFINDPGQPESLPANTVYCFYTDRQNKLWIGTSLGGIVEIIEEKSRFHFRYYKDDKKLAYQGLHAITQDRDGDLLLFTDNGIAIFHPKTGRINHQYEKTSLYPSSFPITTVASHSSYNVLLGTNNGFLSSKHNTSPPLDIMQVAISGFKVFDQDHSHLLHQKEIVLPYNENFFTIDFTVPQYSETKNLTFAYKLIGVDKDWRYTNIDRSATYTDIEGGSYTFEVKAANSQGIWNEQVTKLNISVTPPFWGTTWFKIIAAIILALIIYIIHRYRMRQLLVIHRIRNNISKDLHDEVGATLSSIRILSEVAHQKVKENQLDYSGQLMAKVSIQAAEMAENMSDIIWTFNPYNDHLGKMIQRLQLQFYDLCEAKEIRLQTAISDSAIAISLSLEVRKNIYLICKEAIHNAVKYADGDLIELTVSGGTRLLKIDIRDNGKGFINDPKSQGNGIRNMTLRAEEIKAELSIKPTREGTHININFNPMSNGYTYFNI